MSRNTRVRQLQIVTPEEELENLRNEVGVLRRAVESKSAAVTILRAELQECQRERDKFRTLAEDETLHRSSVSSIAKKPAYSDPCRSAMLSGSEGTLAQLLSMSKEENKMLRLECTELRCKLHDAQADIKVLREEMQRLRGTAEGRRRSQAHNATSQLAHQEREQFISQMESLSAKCQALEGDVRGMVEEREELVRELDASSHKIHRLNHILNTILSNTSPTSDGFQPKRLVDLDAIITENRYLQERLKQTEEEKNLVRSNALKYKNALEKCRTQGTLKLGTQENLIITPKQVSDLLRDYQGEVGGAEETDMKSLCVALVDALNQRSRALRTQRSANKVLASRVTELERRLGGFGNSDGQNDAAEDPSKDKEVRSSEPQIASLNLMEGYVPPSGPLPKYSEDILMKDPRLSQLINGSVENENAHPNPDDDVESLRVNSRKESESSHRNDDDKYTHEKSPDEKSKLASNHISVALSRSGREEISHSKPTSKTSGSDNRESKSKSQIQSRAVAEDDKNKEGNFKVMDAVAHHTNNLDEKVENSSKESTTQNASHEDSKERHSKIKEQKQRSCAREATKNTSKEKVSTYVNPEDELEEIVPIDQLDMYIKEVQEKRRNKVKPPVNEPEGNVREQEVDSDLKTQNGSNSQLALPNENSGSDIVVNQEQTTCHKETTGKEEEEEEEDDDDSSFDLDISDYDSDNDNLDLTLQDWQSDFDKSFPGSKDKSKKAKSSKDPPKKSSSKEKLSFWQRDTSKAPQLSPALKEFLDKATAEVDGTDFT